MKITSEMKKHIKDQLEKAVAKTVLPQVQKAHAGDYAELARMKAEQKKIDKTFEKRRAKIYARLKKSGRRLGRVL